MEARAGTKLISNTLICTYLKEILQSKGELLEKIDKGWAISNQAICGYVKADYTVLLFVLFDSKELECFQQEREAICLKVIENKYLPTVHFINLWQWILQGWTAR